MMRNIPLLVCCFLMFAIPVGAQSEEKQVDERRMGGDLCQKRFSCSEVEGSAAKVTDYAHYCLGEVFGRNNNLDSTFLGQYLDSEECLRNYVPTDKDVSKQKYRCCVYHVNENLCMLRCDRISIR